METKKTEQNTLIGKTEETIEKKIIESPEELAVYVQKNFTAGSKTDDSMVSGLVNSIIDNRKLTIEQKSLLNTVLPMQIAGITITDKKLAAGECWDPMSLT